RSLPGAGDPAAGLPLARRFARRGHRRASRCARGSVQAVPLPHDHELRADLPEGPESGAGHCRHQADDRRAHRVMAGAAAARTTLADGRLRWLLRRGMKELDVLMERYYAGRFPEAPPAEKAEFLRLVTLAEDP